MSDTSFAKVMFVREWQIAMRDKSAWLCPLLFYVAMLMIFPLLLNGQQHVQPIALATVWVSFLFANLLSMDRLFKDDFNDGFLAYLHISKQSSYLYVVMKLIVHWIMSVAPVLLLTPLVGLTFTLAQSVVWQIIMTLLLGTPSVMLMTGFLSLMSVKLNQSGILAGLLVVPLSMPVILFSMSALQGNYGSQAVNAPLSMLAAIVCLSVAILPVLITKTLTYMWEG